ncbi:DUF2586 family protein [Saccharicrinis fermentans]|uniref:Phage tail sheath protein n=1 Tax=Saccharicrinis fermentans DSM 9555 = JCM 21142 TaxID=869213 RepID=W7Y412_9BACT|nr:DUF2586 family protein [Saccharicrinis fermentans]GAF05595.1 hypothetical protein JCM21142_104335 [Saccharicrinis fermentans DSM 9555 = JCM 21142]
MNGVTIDKGDVGAAVNPLADAISGLLINGVEVESSESVTGVTNGTLYKLEKIKDAEAMGIDAAYDVDNDLRVYRHITEFYRMAGAGTPLYLVIGSLSSSMEDLITNYGEQMIIDAGGEIRRIAVAYNQPADYTPTLVDGLEETVRASIALAQELTEFAWDTNRPCNIFLEGRGISGLAASQLNLRNIEVSGVVMQYSNVSIMIGQDWDYADSLTGESKKFADVGTLLGVSASISVNQNIGEVETLDISDANNTIWVTAGLSNHKKITAVETDLSEYDSKGYIFGISYTGITGFRLNDDHVCAPEVVDSSGYFNENTIAHGLTMGKAKRELLTRLLPKVKTVVPVDTSTGKLTTGMIKYFEGIGNTAFDYMAGQGLISGGETVVDPDSDLLTGDKELLVSFTIVPTGTIKKISGTINLKTTL